MSDIKNAVKAKVQEAIGISKNGSKSARFDATLILIELFRQAPDEYTREIVREGFFALGHSPRLAGAKKEFVHKS